MGRNEKHRVVISGIAGRFPNSSNVAEFQKNLLNKVDCTTTEHGRWNIDNDIIPSRIGKCENITKFDRIFFGIHARLCINMDPAVRLVLEHSFEAVIDAGINPRSLKGSNISVYTATNLSESEKSLFNHITEQEGFGIVGCSKSMIPNRISFFLGLTGQSVNMDCSCVGTAAALERAYNNIKDGHCEGAIVAGCLLCLHPHISYQLRELGVLSRDGVTRCFDNHADGYTRSEGIAVLFLQRASDARRIYQEVVGAHSSFVDSRVVNTFIYPKIEPQVKIMRDLLNDCGLTPDDISYLETNGAVRKNLEAEELSAIDQVFGKRKQPLPIGSVKSIVGDAIPVNAFNSIIKLIIASETGQMPATINYKEPNSEAACLKEGRVTVSTDLTPWNGIYSSVNTISNTGAFANIILKSLNIEKKNNGVPEDDIPRLAIVSGRTEEAVTTFLNYLEGRPVDVEFLQMLYDIFSSDVDAFLYRGYTILPAKGMLPPETKKQEFSFNTGEKKEIWWVFSGMGSQWVGMGEALLRLPVFESAIRNCDSILKPKGYDIFKIITEKDPKMFDNIINSFIGIAAIQIGLVDVLKAVGLEPDFIIGHSVGELGCAYADGCFTAEQMIMAALSRGIASTEAILETGSMAAVGLGYDAVKPLCPPDIDIACHNGPESTTISGPAESLKAFVANLTAKGIFAREVPSSNIAFHSRYISPAGPILLERLMEVVPKPNPRSVKWVSTSVPRSEWNTLKARLCSAEYHTNNLLSPVLFDETARQIPANAVCVEIAPHGLLQAILKRSLPETTVNIALTRRGHPDNLEVLLAGLGKLYNVGLQPHIANLYPKVQYPVGRGTPSISSLIKWDHSTEWPVDFYKPVDKVKEYEKTYEIDLNKEEYKYLKGNYINGKIVLPLSLCLVNVWEILKSASSEEREDIVFENLKVYKKIVAIPENEILKLTVMVPKGSGKFEVIESEQIVLSGTIKTTKAAGQERLDVYHFKNSEEIYDLNKEDFYTEMKMRGYQYKKDFKTVLNASMDGTKALLDWNENWVTFIDSVFQLYAFGNDSRQVEWPISIQKIVVDLSQQQNAISLSKEIPAIINKKMNFASAGGLEIQGLKHTVLPRSLEQNYFSVHNSKVIPNIDNSKLSLASCLRLILQLIIENTFSNKIQKIQLITHHNEAIVEKLYKLMFDIPEATLFVAEAIIPEEATFKVALTVITDFKLINISEISEKLEVGKFVLTFIPTCQQEKEFIKTAESFDLKVVLMRKTPDETIILFRKKLLLTNFQTVMVTENVQDAIDKIKSIKILHDDERIIPVITPKSNINISQFLKKLQVSVNLQKVRIFNIQDPNLTESSFRSQLYTNQLELDFFINFLTQENVWATLRHKEIDMKPKSCIDWTSGSSSSYNPTNIIWTEGPKVKNEGNTVKVKYCTLNQEDILIANGSFYTDLSETVGYNRLKPLTVGLEFSGTDANGNRVMGVTCGKAMSNYVVADPEFLWTIPNSWSLEDAATVPFSYVIAYTALMSKAGAKPGEKVLLCNSCDGFGLAILHLAVKQECDVYVTYKNETEKNLIRTVCPNLPKNRLFELTADSVRDDVLIETKGQGVDVIISNQCEIKKLEVFFTMTKQRARVVLISNLNDNKVHESVGMYIFLREISLFSVVPKRILISNTATKKYLSDLIKKGIDVGTVKPLSKIVYPQKSLNEAFKACVENKHLGKIVVEVQPKEVNVLENLVTPKYYCSENKSHLIIEGLTNFGLELVDWLITRGARHFVIASSQKCASGYQKLRLKTWESYGVKFIIHEEIDLSERNNIKSLCKETISLGPLEGVFDLRRTSSIYLKESVNLTTQLVDEETRCLGSKVHSFVICSINSDFHDLDDINYDLQSSEMKQILKKRKTDGLHGVFINFSCKNAHEKMKNSEDFNNILPPIKKYLENIDQVLGSQESFAEISFVSPSTHEVEESAVEIEESEIDVVKKEIKSYHAYLNFSQTIKSILSAN